MIDCKKAAYIIDTKAYKPTSFIKKLGLKFHLVICPHCAKYEKDSKAVDHIVRYVSQHAAALSEAEKKEMIRKLQAKLSN
ncbi:MAG: hypothetical protein R3279_02900 [Putridiphycobacter sp.]|nr:hypothetical protein [Putridiphycobacter sp.]